ncbi:MAG: hypothetical protein RL217_1099 [Pseudomonadota bacterium]|jgi:organic hydroperoxide reductase OsmC/OhrA
MSEHQAQIRWHKDGEFSHEGFNRKHQIAFENNEAVTAGGANNDFGTDPEQLLAGALASCHMQTFLAVAAKKRLVVESYEDVATATVQTREDGKMWVAKIKLTPKATFAGEKIPDAETVRAMHEKAHAHCFVANSLSGEALVSPRF